MDNALLIGLISFILIFLIGGCIVTKYLISPSEKDKQAARDFLEGLRDALMKMIASTIANFNYKEYSNLPEIELDLLNKITDTCRDYICAELEKSTDIISVLTLKVLNSGMIDKFIEELINNADLEINIQYNLSESFEEVIKKNAEDDEKYIKEFANSNEYNNNVENPELPDAEEEIISEEELAKLNPPREEGEEEYNADDNSMEIIEDNDIYIDKSGRARSKSTNKWVKKK